MSDEELPAAVVRANETIVGDYTTKNPPSTNGKHAPDDAPIKFGDECRLSEEFWDFAGDGPLGDRLRHIRAAAWSVQRSPTATFGVCLSRMAAGMPHTIKLDAIVGSEQPLTLFVVTVGGSGSGKGDGAANATRLLPTSTLDLLHEGITDHLPPGSGQGFIDVLFDMVEVEESKPKKFVKTQTRSNAFFEMDEGEALGALAGKDHVLLESMRTVWSGKTVGQTNVEAERRRVLPAGTYSYGVNIQVQPTKAAELIEDDAGGTPQRFLWFPTMDPSIPQATGEILGPLDWAPPGPQELSRIAVMPGGSGGYVRHYLTQHPDIVDEIRAHDLAVQRGEKTVAPLDAHRLNMRRRVAALLALLDGKLHVALDHWSLSALVMAVSDATRAVVLGATIKVRADENERRRRFQSSVAVAQDEAVATQRTVSCATKIAEKVRAEPEQWRYSTMRRSLTKRDQEVYTDAVEHAVSMSWVVVGEIDGQGESKRPLRPGKKKP